jgi:hypothetical protein
MQRAALDRLLAILHNARRRKEMYFSPVAPVPVVHWLHGLRTGASFTGLEWSAEHFGSALARRGLKFLTIATEVEELRARGLSDEAIVDELLSIEIEMWESVRNGIA